jgi:hypothetical protein
MDPTPTNYLPTPVEGNPFFCPRPPGWMTAPRRHVMKHRYVIAGTRKDGSNRAPRPTKFYSPQRRPRRSLEVDQAAPRAPETTVCTSERPRSPSRATPTAFMPTTA